MKTILTIILVLFTATTAMANTNANEMKVETVTYGVVLDIKIEKEAVKEQETARLYMFKNSRIKKALKFRTKANKSKIA